METEPRKMGDYLSTLPLASEEDDARAIAKQEQNRRREELQAMARRMNLCFADRERYRRCSTDNFKLTDPGHGPAVALVNGYAKDMMVHVGHGQGVIFYGPPGTGKDHLMAHLLTTAIRAGLSAQWVNGMDLFGDARDRMTDERASERSFVDRLVSPAILAISDPAPPFGEITQYQAAMLFRIIDGRYSQGKATWITINAMNAEEAGKKIGYQTIDRLRDGATVVPCVWPSYRTSLKPGSQQ